MKQEMPLFATAIFLGGALSCGPGASHPDAAADVVSSDVATTVDARADSDAGVNVDVTASPDLGICANPDMDGDGFRAVACGGNDCDDTDPNRYPTNSEVCLYSASVPTTMRTDPTHDEDCDPSTYANAATHDGDHDGDGYVDHACANVDRSGMTTAGTDCADVAAVVGFPGTTYMTTVAPQNIHPSQTESCNGVDDNCNGHIDEGVQTQFYFDCDGDGFGDQMDPGMSGCTPAQFPVCMGHPPVTNHSDCNDGNPMIHPGAPAMCDAAMTDWSCTGMHGVGCACTIPSSMPCGSSLRGCAMGTEPCVMSGTSSTWGTCSVSNTLITCYTDADGDGYAPASAYTSSACTCARGSGWTATAPTGSSIDCVDADASIFPGAAEVCNGHDDNCNGIVDLDIPGANCVGGSAPRSAFGCMAGPFTLYGTQTCSSCVWSATTYPADDSCNGVDDNCNGQVDESAGSCRLLIHRSNHPIPGGGSDRVWGPSIPPGWTDDGPSVTFYVYNDATWTHNVFMQDLHQCGAAGRHFLAVGSCGGDIDYGSLGAVYPSAYSLDTGHTTSLLYLYHGTDFIWTPQYGGEWMALNATGWAPGGGRVDAHVWSTMF